MKIIKKGEVQPKKIYRGECKKCGLIVEAEEDELYLFSLPTFRGKKYASNCETARCGASFFWYLKKGQEK